MSDLSVYYCTANLAEVGLTFLRIKSTSKMQERIIIINVLLSTIASSLHIEIHQLILFRYLPFASHSWPNFHRFFS